MLVRDSKGHYESIGKSMISWPVHILTCKTDFREIAPAAAFEDMYQGNLRGSIFSGLSAAVPGEVKGLEYLHQKYGV
jgi:gamma-glutamyltranspeptidase/glutathione hydrolase